MMEVRISGEQLLHIYYTNKFLFGMLLGVKQSFKIHDKGRFFNLWEVLTFLIKWFLDNENDLFYMKI